MEKVIYDILLVAMLVVSAFIIVAIFMQPSKQDGAADAFRVEQVNCLNVVKRAVLRQ